MRTSIAISNVLKSQRLEVRFFHTSSFLQRKKNRVIRPYKPNHPTKETMSEALYDLRKESQKHNVYHPDEIDFGGFLKSIPQPNFEQDINKSLNDGLELLTLIPKKLNGDSNTEKKTKTKKKLKKKISESESYDEKLQQWIHDNHIPCKDLNIIFRVFIHPNWIAHNFSNEPNIRNLINRISNQKLAQKGSDILNFVMQSYLTSHTEHNTDFLKHYEENRTKMTLLLYNDPSRFQDYMTHDLKEIQRRIMSNEALSYVADKLNLKSLLLSNFSIIEEVEVSEDDLLPRTDSEYMVFPASKKGAIDSHELILKSNLLEALIGGIHLDSGIEVATQFIVDIVRPLLYEYIHIVDEMDYVKELQDLLKQFRSHVDFRSLKDPVNRGEVKVGVFIGTRYIDAAYGETFAIAKYRAAQKVYLDLKHNPIRIKQLEDSLVNQGYIQSLNFLKLQRIRDCMEYVPGSYQQVSRKQYKINKNDVNFYIQNRYLEK